MLTSNGDLQIVQLHRTDAGTYVCVAYNGIGNTVQREITLTVDGKITKCLFSFFFGNDECEFLLQFLKVLRQWLYNNILKLIGDIF